MGSSLEEVAKNWLVDPAWQKVFKHTFDVIEDYVSYILVAVGAISLSVRLLTTLSSGDLVCIVIGGCCNNNAKMCFVLVLGSNSGRHGQCHWLKVPVISHAARVSALAGVRIRKKYIVSLNAY